jgi:hypothetical protein
MKRVIKLFLNLVLASIAVGLTLLVVFLITPSWQKLFVEETLSRDSARRWQVGSVSIHPTGVELEDVYVLDGPVGAEIKYIQWEGPLWKILFSQELEIESGSITGLDMDVSKIRVGDLTSDDYQAFLKRVSGDVDFWKERIGLVLSKLSAMGMDVRIENLQISGSVLMPGEKVVPVRWMIINADSRSPRLIRIEPTAAAGPVL